MEMTRRGFLWTMMAATAGTAMQLDAANGLWVPKPASDLIQIAKDMGLADRYLELQALAVRMAQMVGQELLSTPIQYGADQTVIMDRVEYAGLASRRAAVSGYRLDIPELGGQGYFEPTKKRLVATLPMRPAAATPGDLASMAYDLTNRVRHEHLRVIAPISDELRQGVPFTMDTQVAVGHDEETGASVRVLAFETHEGPRTMFEVTGGSWWTPGQTYTRLKQQKGKRFAKYESGILFGGGSEAEVEALAADPQFKDSAQWLAANALDTTKGDS